ncbi:hypothetical protein FSP39_017023 [Pinctada imbricata]|uniref:MULE transposase domain-containing protein n=1 Tax=Pinctada imbricata TaxID=66713 RepID=A0AA88YJA3_PINIB|nr:hypothetical protein FSP39_017023 [Pinctada imbricata]
MQIEVHDLMQIIKRRCRDELTPIPTIYSQEITSIRQGDWTDESRQLAESLPTSHSAKNSLYTQRSKTIPALPKTLADINLPDHWTTTTADEKFLVADDGMQDRLLIFATRQSLAHLASADTIYADGTFYACPSLFKQLYTIYGFVDGAMYPLVYALLPGKSEAIYRRMFGLLINACQRHNLTLSPNTIFLDFETAPRNAALHHFPGIIPKGCFFHFTQCIWRKTQESGLQVPYQEIDSVQQLVRRAAVLPLLSAEDVEDVWFYTLEDFDAADSGVDVTTFTDYVTEYWVEGNRHLWNHFEAEGPRTTNNLEGWHSKLNKHFNHPHPNIYRLIDVIKRIQAANEVQQVQYAAGGKRATRKRKYKEIDRRLDDLKTTLNNGEITALAYADAASHLIHLG